MSQYQKTIPTASDHPGLPLSKWSRCNPDRPARDPFPFAQGLQLGWIKTQRWNKDPSYVYPTSAGSHENALHRLQRRRSSQPSVPSIATSTPGSQTSMSAHRAFMRSRNEKKLPSGKGSGGTHFSRRDAPPVRRAQSGNTFFSATPALQPWAAPLTRTSDIDVRTRALRTPVSAGTIRGSTSAVGTVVGPLNTDCSAFTRHSVLPGMHTAIVDNGGSDRPRASRPRTVDSAQSSLSRPHTAGTVSCPGTLSIADAYAEMFETGVSQTTRLSHAPPTTAAAGRTRTTRTSHATMQTTRLAHANQSTAAPSHVYPQLQPEHYVATSRGPRQVTLHAAYHGAPRRGSAEGPQGPLDFASVPFDESDLMVSHDNFLERTQGILSSASSGQ